MRVLVVTPWFPSSASPGSGTFVADACAAASGRSHSLFVAHLAGPAGVDVQAGLPVIRTGRPPLGAALGSLVSLRAAVRGLDFDLVHAHVFSAGLAALGLGRRVVLSEHYSGVALPGLSRRSRVAARVAYAGADLVCPVSGALAARMPCSGPMRVVGNAVDTSVFFPSGSPPLRRIVAVGGLVPVKGFDVLVSVAARLPEDLEVVIAGDGPERGRLSALGGGRVSFVGRLSRPDVASLLRSASVAVVPSRWETQGVAALEALCCGVPVVASAAGGLPEVVGPGDGLLVPPGQPAALAAALLRAVETDWDRPAIAARAAARHGYEAIGARWRAIYEEVAGG